MTKIKGAVDSIETFGLVDGPGIRTVVFLSGCKLRCKYCHNPEMWVKGEENYTPEELAKKLLRNKNYFKRKGGVTFSGGEPLLQSKFIIEVAKILKKENIHIALDTSGVGMQSRMILCQMQVPSLPTYNRSYIPSERCSRGLWHYAMPSPAGHNPRGARVSATASPPYPHAMCLRPCSYW